MVGMVADSCIEIIFDILDIINTDDRLLKDILDYVISDIVKSILSEINEKYFRNSPTLLDEFRNVIKNLDNILGENRMNL